MLPASVFTSEKSLLLAPIGCVGGPGHEGNNATLACGNTYTPSTPTVDLIALGMSRITVSSHIALQVVNASVALTASDIGITPSIQDAPNQPLATALPTGGIEPKPPFTKLTLNELGAPRSGGDQDVPPRPRDDVSHLDHAARRGVSERHCRLDAARERERIRARGRRLVPQHPAGAFWHKLTYALIKANP